MLTTNGHANMYSVQCKFTMCHEYHDNTNKSGSVVLLFKISEYVFLRSLQITFHVWVIFRRCLCRNRILFFHGLRINRGNQESSPILKYCLLVVYGNFYNKLHSTQYSQLFSSSLKNNAPCPDSAFIYYNHYLNQIFGLFVHTYIESLCIRVVFYFQATLSEWIISQAGLYDCFHKGLQSDLCNGSCNYCTTR